MPWNSGTGKMTFPINTNIGGDIQKATNTTYNGDIGYTITQAAQNGRINMFAKYKPVRYSHENTADQLDMSGSTPANWTWKSDSDWWKSDNVVSPESSAKSCGINIPRFTSGDDLAAAYADGETYKWGYLYPRGGSSEPFRLFDFGGYNKNARCPIYGWDVANQVSPSSSDTITLDVLTTSASDELSLADIPGLSDRYFGFAMYLGSTLALVATAQETITANDTTSRRVSYTVPSTSGTYTVYPFLSKYPQATQGASFNMTGIDLVSIPFGSRTMKVSSEGLVAKISVSGTITYHSTSNNYTIEYSYSFKAPNSGSVTFRNATLSVGIQPASGSSTIIKTKSLGDVTVEAGSTVSGSGTFVEASDKIGTDGIQSMDMYAMFNNSSFVQLNVSNDSAFSYLTKRTMYD